MRKSINYHLSVRISSSTFVVLAFTFILLPNSTTPSYNNWSMYFQPGNLYILHPGDVLCPRSQLCGSFTLRAGEAKLVTITSQGSRSSARAHSRQETHFLIYLAQRRPKWLLTLQVFHFRAPSVWSVCKRWYCLNDALTASSIRLHWDSHLLWAIDTFKGSRTAVEMDLQVAHLSPHRQEPPESPFHLCNSE